MCTGVCWGKLNVRHHLEDPGVDGRIIQGVPNLVIQKLFVITEKEKLQSYDIHVHNEMQFIFILSTGIRRCSMCFSRFTRQMSNLYAISFQILRLCPRLWPQPLLLSVPSILPNLQEET